MSRNSCTFCGKLGHNRRSCSALKQRIREDPDGYYARVAKRKAKEAIANPRRCGYCKETGHNRKTCKALKKDCIEISQKIKTWRIDFLNRARENGFAPGALVKFMDPDTITNTYSRGRLKNAIEKCGKYGIVTQLDHTKLDHRQLRGATRCVLVRFPNGSQQFHPLPMEFTSLLTQEGYGYEPLFHIVGPVKTTNLHNHFSVAWHNGLDTAEDFLQN
jgi:hypothetical protein